MTQRGGTLSGGEQQMLAIGRAPSPADAHEPSLGRPPDRPPDFRCHPHPQPPGRPDGADRRTETRAPWLRHGQRPDHAVGNRKRIAAASGNPRSPIWKADGEVSLSCGTTPLRVVPVHGPIPRMLRFCAGPRYLSFGCCGCGPTLRRGQLIVRHHAAKVPWICPKFADDFAAKSADNGLGLVPGVPGASLRRRPTRTAHEITEAHRPGIGRIVCTVRERVRAGHHHRSGRPDDGLRNPPSGAR